MRKYLILLVCIIGTQATYAQSTKLNTLASLSGDTEVSVIFNALEAETSFVLSYNPLAIDLMRVVTIPQGHSWNQILDLLEARLGLQSRVADTDKKILITPSSHIIITGVVKDSSSLESLTSVAVFSKSNEGVYTNEEGYFRIKLPRADQELYVSYLGWKTKVVKLNKGHKQNIQIQLAFDNQLPELIIRDDSWNQLTTVGTWRNNVDHVGEIKGIGGSADLTAKLKTGIGVSVGYEAQNGFLVRGGGPDQNLVLVDGVPLFETTHLGGISSVFSEDIVKSAELYKGAVPARFGGRLSSTLDIRLKDGNRKEYNRSISIGLERISGLIEGPLGENTSFILNGRASILSTYITPILRQYNNLETQLNYNDLYFKVSHWFSNTSRLSVKIINVADEIGIDDSGEIGNSIFFDSNRIDWNNRLLGVNWKKDLSDKVFLHTQLGSSSFNFDSKSVNKVFEDNLVSDSLNVRSTSCHDFFSGQAYVDIFTEKLGSIKLGLGGVQYNSAPSILEQEILDNEVEEEQFCGDSLYQTTELYAFLEQEIILSKFWSANLGLRFNALTGLDTSNTYLQPRLSITYKEFPHIFSMDYSRMNQFLHLLINPSSGLPSDLWVPSTSIIEPETSNLFSINYARKSKGLVDFSIGAFYRNYNNIIEYTDPTDIIQVIGQQNIFNFNTQDIRWEDRVTTGTGESYGIELNIAGTLRKLNYNIAYTLSRSFRTLVIDGEETTFPYKFDRPHNLSITMLRSLSERSNLQVNFAFGDGLRWTVPNSVEVTSAGTVVRATERNNLRLGRFYHHLDVSYTTTRTILEENDLELTLGLYNIYNKQNPFYGQLVEGGEPGVANVREIYLFPIFPQINAKFNW